MSAAMMIGPAVRGVMGAGQLIHFLLNKPGDRPKMTTPGAVKEATARSRNLANSSKDAILTNQEQNIDRGASSAMNNVKRSAGNSSDVISGLTEVSGRSMQAKNDAQDSYAGRKLNYEQNYQGNLQTEGQYERQNFQYNEVAPYEEEVTARNQMIQAGLGNITDAGDMFSVNKIVQGQGMPQTTIDGSYTTKGQPSTGYGSFPPGYQFNQKQPKLYKNNPMFPSLY